METKKWSIEIYELIDGRRPYDDWLNHLSDKISRARIRARLDKVASGNLGDFKNLGDGIYELRFSFGPGFRVYYGMKNHSLIILLIGGDKSTQSKDIERAKIFWNDYLKRTYEKS